MESQNAPGRTSPDLYTRHWGTARIVASDEDIFVFSAHLHPNDERIREREISGILREMEKALKTGRSVLFQGDFNHRPDSPEYRRWEETGLVDTFAAKGAGQSYTSSPIEPKARIDYIWCYEPISAGLREARCLFEGSFRTNPADLCSTSRPELARWDLGAGTCAVNLARAAMTGLTLPWGIP